MSIRWLASVRSFFAGHFYNKFPEEIVHRFVVFYMHSHSRISAREERNTKSVLFYGHWKNFYIAETFIKSIMHHPSAVLLSLFHFALSTTVEPPAVKFWLSVELQSITWKLGCLNTGGCAEPRLRLLKSNLVNGEKLSIDWPVTGDIVKVQWQSTIGSKVSIVP